MIQMRLMIISIIVMLSPIRIPMIFAHYDSKADQVIYKIETAEDLYNIRTSPGAIYLLMNDIDVSEYPVWTPINNFDGILDGNGYTIEGLKIDGRLKRSGLFDINQGIIRNIVIQEPEISSISTEIKAINIGIIAVENKGTIKNVYIDEVNMEWITLEGSIVGGLVGKNNGKIQYCHVSGMVKGKVVGGLVGRNEKLGVIGCSSFSGVVESYYYMGGLVGNNLGEVGNCFSQTLLKMVGDELVIYVGGIAGQNTGGINYCYVDARVDRKNWGNSRISGVAPISSQGIMRQSFYNKDNVEPTFALEGIEKEGRSTEEMKLKATYMEEGWNFDSTWGIEDGASYPYLWEVGRIPVEPEEPLDPDPEEPVDPEEPADPEPDEPVDPEEPLDPNPDEPVDSEEPADPDPDEPVDSEEQADPNESADPRTTIDLEQAPIITPMELKLMGYSKEFKEFLPKLGWRSLIKLSKRHYGLVDILSAVTSSNMRNLTTRFKMELGVSSTTVFLVF